MSNNNYITIQLSFLSYILFVFTLFEAFVRNAILDVFAVAQGVPETYSGVPFSSRSSFFFL